MYRRPLVNSRSSCRLSGKYQAPRITELHAMPPQRVGGPMDSSAATSGFWLESSRAPEQLFVNRYRLRRPESERGAVMVDQLSSGLIARLRERAGNAERRSDDSEMAASSASGDDMLGSVPKSDDPAVREYLEGMNTPFAGMISNMVTGDSSQAKGLFGALGQLLGGKQIFGMIGPSLGSPGGMFSVGGSGKPGPAPPPCTEAEVAAAEAKLGFVLPGDLRLFYLEVADGGVGPGAGIYSLKQLLAKWRE